jgi:hypothetical protein
MVDYSSFCNNYQQLKLKRIKNMTIRINEFSRGFVEVETPEGFYVSGGFRLPPEQLNRLKPSQLRIPTIISQAVKEGEFDIPDEYSPVLAAAKLNSSGNPSLNSIALIARDLGNYSVLVVATGQMDETDNDVVVGYRYFWLDKTVALTLDGIKTLLHWWWQKGCPCFDMNPLAWEQQTQSKEFYIAESISYDHQSTTITNPEYIPVLLEVPESELSLEILEQFHQQALQLHTSYDIQGWDSRVPCPLAWAWNVRSLTHPDKFAVIAYTLEDAFDIIQQPLQNLKIGQRQILEKHQPTENTLCEITGEDMQNKVPCVSVPYDEIRKLLIGIANNPNNSKKNVELLCCLETFSPEIWESCFDQQTVAQVQANPLVNTVKYKALVTMLVPSSVPGWLSWVKAQKNSQESLTFQEEIWETSQQNKNARENLRKLIRGGISELLCQLTLPGVSDDTYENVKWLLVKQQRENVWHDRFRSYSKDIFDNLRSLCLEDPNKQGNIFYSLLAQTLRELDKQEWTTTRPEFIRIAKLIEKYENYELAAIFYQISNGSVPQNVRTKMSKIDEQYITEYIPLRKAPANSLLDKFKPKM